nr:hypothetical protein BaRGS_008433 [Batillaria attramentaria]
MSIAGQTKGQLSPPAVCGGQLCGNNDNDYDDHRPLPSPSVIHHFAGGRNIWVIGGMSYTKGISTKMVCYYDIKRRRWRDAFPLPEGSFANLDCCLLQIPADNKDYCFMDRYLYDRWILW